MSAVVRVAEELLPWMDKAVDSIKDEYGVPKFKTRKDLVDSAVKAFLDEIRETPCSLEPNQTPFLKDV